MLKEICITPQVFEEKQLVTMSASWKDLKNLLESIYGGGYIVGLNNDEWVKSVRGKINLISDQKVKDILNNLISNLKDRKRIVGHPKSEVHPNAEIEWLAIAENLNRLHEFNFILATQQYFENVTSIEQLEFININEKFGITGSRHSIKTDEELKKIFLPFLAYARKVTIIDPYFDISEKRYKVTLNLIANYFKNKRGIIEPGEIYIHCSSKIETKESWKNLIADIYEKYKHIVKINVWDRKIDAIKLHDRYIITDQAGLVSGAGTDKDDYQQSEWSIKDYATLDEILRQYKENSSPFLLKAVITASKIEKK